MESATARIISLPTQSRDERHAGDAGQGQYPDRSEPVGSAGQEEGGGDLFERIIEGKAAVEQAVARQRACLAESSLLKVEKRWEDILAMSHSLEEKEK